MPPKNLNAYLAREYVISQFEGNVLPYSCFVFTASAFKGIVQCVVAPESGFKTEFLVT